MKTKIFGVLSLACLCPMFQACSATYMTVAPHKEATLCETVDSLEGESCVSIPRVYSGTFYNYCILTRQISQKSAYTLDILSVPGDFIVDTVLLPYTMARQAAVGDIVLKAQALSAK